VLEKLQAQEGAKQGDARPDGDEALKRFAAIADRFKYKVPFETGATDFKDDARIEIVEVWGTRPKIEIGGQYVVRGKYVLPSHDHGTVYFYESASRPENASGPIMDLQRADVRKGQGEFTLTHVMGFPGSFHVELVCDENGQSNNVADIYFGTGDNVYRKTP
jgi:hypothetical protein